MLGFQVHHQALKSAGSGATSTAKKLASSTTQLHEGSSQAIAAHPGWASSAALQQCLTAWGKRLKDLSYEVQTIGQNLITSNSAYEAANAKVVAQLNELAAQIQRENE
jgi:hypothetical protein